MLKSGILLCIIAICASANSELVSIAHAKQWFYPGQIAPKALSGITDCGVSELVDVRLNGCTSAPCQVTIGRSYELEVDFKPRDFHWDMHLRAIILKDTHLQLLTDNPVPESTVEAGKLYTFKLPFTVPSEVTGASELRMKLFQNYVHELCLVIPFNIVN